MACLGWGSLIWNPQNLKLQSKWFEDGVLLPIEFTRISSDDRVTLIIDRKAKEVRTLWALMTCDDLEEAKESLKDREKVSNMEKIHSISINENTSSDTHRRVQNWMKEKHLDSVIWTGLSYRDEARPSIEEILIHLKGLSDVKGQKAEEYIRKAPRQIDTEYRRRIEAELGWLPL